MTKISFVHPLVTDEAFTYDEVATDNMINCDGFVVTIRPIGNSWQVKVFLEVAKGLYEPAEVTEHIKALVHAELGINPEHRQTGSSLKDMDAARKARKEAKSEAQLTDTTPPAKEPKEMPTKLSVAELLTQCTEVIAELQGDLSIAQVHCRSLADLTGSYHMSKLAKVQLIEKGLIEYKGKGVVLTELGQQCNIGTHTRSPDTGAQVIRYSEKVMEYIDLNEAGKVSKAKPFQKTVPTFTLIDPEGNEHVVTEVIKFAKAHGLISSKVYLLRKGVLGTHRGWKLA